MSGEHGAEEPREPRVEIFAAQGEQVLAAGGPLIDHATVAEDAPVMGERRLRDALDDRSATVFCVIGQRPHDPQAQRVAQGSQYVLERNLVAIRVSGDHGVHHTDRSIVCEQYQTGTTVRKMTNSSAGIVNLESLDGHVSPHSSRRWVALGALAMAQLVFSLDLNIVFVALPTIGMSLGFSDQTAQWVVSAYVVVAGGFLLLGGRAADLLGRRRTFIVALRIYAGSSLAGGFATSPATMIAARAAQGLGGALLLPSTLALINTLYGEGPARNRALAVWGGFGASGLTVGALLGGVLTELFGWPAVFFVNVPLAVAVVAVALWAIPPDAKATERRRFDLPGAVSVTIAATAFVFTLVQGPEVGWDHPSVVTAATLTAIFTVAFVRLEASSPDPLMPMRLWRSRHLVIGALITFVFMGTFGALPYFLTIHLQQQLGFTALQSGLAFLVPSVAIAAGTQIGGRLAGTLGLRRTLVIGFVVGIIGTIALAAGFGSGGYGPMVPGLLVSGLGQGVIWTAMFITSATGVPSHEQGVANGIATTALNLGSAIGLAVLVAVAGVLGDSVVVGGQWAVLISAGGMLAGLFAASALRGPRG